MNRELLYWIIVLVVFLYLLNKHRRNSFYILIIMFFFEGLFTYFGKTSWNFYKIFLPLFALYSLIRQSKHVRADAWERWIISVFFVFSIFFFFSSYNNSDPPLLFLNQYSRYLMPLMTFFILKAHAKRGVDFNSVNMLIKNILTIQIVLTFLNFILMGTHENIVGSMSSNGGALATLIPVLGLMFIWLSNDGRMERKDWIYFLLLMFVGFESNKRAIWVIAPIAAMLLAFYIPRKKVPVNFLLVVPLLPLLFYIGIRLSPTLNPDGKIWGRFDFSYFYDYSMNYTFGDENKNEVHVGRGGATLLTIESILNKDISLLGSGLRNIYAYDEEANENSQSPILISDLNSITMATGIFQNYYTGGLIGVITFLLYVFSLLFMVREKRLRFVMILLYAWEYLLYANTIMRLPALSFIFIYIIVYSNIKYQRDPSYYLNVNPKASYNIP